MSDVDGWILYCFSYFFFKFSIENDLECESSSRIIAAHRRLMRTETVGG